jgi:hypothetical protein
MALSALVWGFYPLGMKIIAEKGDIVLGLILMKFISGATAAILLFALAFFPGKDRLGWALFKQVGQILFGKRARTLVACGVPTTTGLYLCQLSSFSRAGTGDVTVTIIIEFWPIITALMLTIAVSKRLSLLEKKDYGLKISDTPYLFLCLIGYIFLLMANVESNNFSIASTPVWIITATFGLILQGLGTTIWFIVFERVKVDLELSDREKLVAAVSVEAIQRFGIFFLMTLLSSLGIPGLEITQRLSWDLIQVTGTYAILIMVFGSVLLMLGMGDAKRASITFLYYLMPVCAIMILSLYNGRWLNGPEVSAALILILVNVFLNVRLPLGWAFKGFFLALAALGIVTHFFGQLPQDFYYSLASLPAIFYGLLAAYALTRLHTRMTDVHAGLVDVFKRMRLLAKQVPIWTRYEIVMYVHALCSLVYGGRVSQGGEEERLRLVITMRDAVLAICRDYRDFQQDILDLVSSADAVAAKHGHHLTLGELISLLSLLCISVTFNIVYRDPSVAGDAFAISLSAAAIFVFALILEFNRMRTNNDYLRAVVEQSRSDLHEPNFSIFKEEFLPMGTQGGDSSSAQGREGVIVAMILFMLTVTAVAYLILTARGVVVPAPVP